MEKPHRDALRTVLEGIKIDPSDIVRSALLELLQQVDALEEDVTELLKQRQAAWDIWPVCQSCDHALATCFGAYEDSTPVEWACDLCCGHGNEDGWCKPLKQATVVITHHIKERLEKDPW